MSNTNLGEAQKGSKRCVQRFVAHAPERLADHIVCGSPSLSGFQHTQFEWKSPLAATLSPDGNDFYEYRDDFLVPLGLEQHSAALREFWPRNGPQWDALALLHATPANGVVLVEAKAYPDELGTPCTAGEESRRRIHARLEYVRGYMGAHDADWLGRYYQVANRLAMLYFLNVRLQVPTWLVLLNFVRDTYRSTSIDLWRKHQQQVFQEMGIHPGCRLLDRIITLCIEPEAPDR